MHSSKKINVFPFSLFGFCYEVYLHFWPLPAKHFQQEHSLCHDSNICETAYPVSVHQKILLLGSFCLVLGESLRQKESVPNLLFDISEIKFIEEIRHFRENCLILHLQSGHQIIHSFRVSILDTSIEKYKNI